MPDVGFETKIRDLAKHVEPPARIRSVVHQRTVSGQPPQGVGSGFRGLRATLATAGLAAIATTTFFLVGGHVHQSRSPIPSPLASNPSIRTPQQVVPLSPNATTTTTTTTTAAPSSSAHPAPSSPTARSTPTPAATTPPNTPITRVQIGPGTVTDANKQTITDSPTLPAASTKGNLLTVSIAINADFASATDLTAPPGWIEVTTSKVTSNGMTAAVFYYPNNPGGITTASFTTNGTAYGVWAVMAEWHGASATNPLRGGASNSASNTTSIAVTAPAAGGDVSVVAFAAFTTPSCNVAWTPGPGWSQQAGQAAPQWSNGHGAADYLLIAGGGATVTDAETAQATKQTGGTTPLDLIIGASATFGP